jgi:hypothetical protein
MSANPNPQMPPPIVKRSRLALEKSLADLRANTAAYGSVPSAASPYQAEAEAVSAGSSRRQKARKRLWQNGLRTLQFVLASAEDHIQCTIVLLRGWDIPVFASATLARAACEATAQICHLLDPALTPEGRLLRGESPPRRKRPAQGCGATARRLSSRQGGGGRYVQGTRRRDRRTAPGMRIRGLQGKDLLAGRCRVHGDQPKDHRIGAPALSPPAQLVQLTLGNSP